MSTPGLEQLLGLLIFEEFSRQIAPKSFVVGVQTASLYEREGKEGAEEEKILKEGFGGGSTVCAIFCELSLA